MDKRLGTSTVGKVLLEAQHLEEAREGPKCSNGHLMKQTKQVIARKNRAGENIGSGQSLRCNGCRDNVDPLKGYFHCGNNFCDNDLCLSCGKVGKVLNRNLEGVNISDADSLHKVGLCRFRHDNYDFLFDEDGNVFGLKGKFVGNHHEELENYFEEHGYD